MVTPSSARGRSPAVRRRLPTTSSPRRRTSASIRRSSRRSARSPPMRGRPRCSRCRPELPRWRETKPRDYMIVVDSSQSMVGERFTRAGELALAMVDQMDRRDRFSVAACDSECARPRRPARAVCRPRRPTSSSGSRRRRPRARATWSHRSARPRTSRRRGPREVDPLHRRRVRLDRVPQGRRGREGARAASRPPASTSPRSASAATRTSRCSSAAARGGGGSYLAWVPGESVGDRGDRGARVDQRRVAARRHRRAPARASSDVAPTVLPTIRSGEEVLLAARVGGERQGRRRGPRHRRRQAVRAAVPAPAPGVDGGRQRVRPAAVGDARDRTARAPGRRRRPHSRIVALSQGYGVMSRETSLLVLESQAMFDAFGVDRSSPAAKWTGEDDLDEVVTAGTVPVATPTPDAAAPAAAKATTMMSLDDGKAGKKDADKAAREVRGADAREEAGPDEPPERGPHEPDQRRRRWRRRRGRSVRSRLGPRPRHGRDAAHVGARPVGVGLRRGQRRDQEGDREQRRRARREAPTAARSTARSSRRSPTPARSTAPARSRTAGSSATSSIRRRWATRPICSAATASASWRCARSPAWSISIRIGRSCTSGWSARTRRPAG